MILKSKRVKARGQALQRLVAHLTNGEDNDEVELVRGNMADLMDWRDDALRFGREYAVRHWIASPEQEITGEQLDTLIGWLAAEFGLDPAIAVAWKHRKQRATPDGCPQHFHILANEVDPLAGSVMSSSHDYARHQKLSMGLSLMWGHPVAIGPHFDSAVAALEAEGIEVPAHLSRQSGNHGQGFDERSHQRLKRRGIDLPRVRVLVTEALAASRSLEEFEAKLAAIGLRLEAGRKGGIPVLMTSDGATFVGSLSRLTRFTKAELKQRMIFHGRDPSSASDRAAAPPDSDSTDETSVETSKRDGGSEPTRSHRHHDPAAGANSSGGGAGPRTPGAAGISAESTAAATLMLHIGCHRQHAKLLDLLSIARRAAMSPPERVDLDLHDRIEAETTILNQSDELPEPAALLAARRAVDKAMGRLRELERRSSNLARRINALPPPTFWNHLMGLSHEAEKERLQAKSEAILAKIKAARSVLADSKHVLATQQTNFAQERIQRGAALAARQQQATKFLKIGEIAKTRLAARPELGFAGLAYVLRLAALPRARHAALSGDEHGEFGGRDDVVLYDEWGKPYKANPQASW